MRRNSLTRSGVHSVSVCIKPRTVRWDISQAFILLYVAISVPLRIGFNLEAVGVSYTVELIVELYFYIDMLLNFITTYEDANMKVITNCKMIVKNYLSSWFFVDFISGEPKGSRLRSARIEKRLKCTYAHRRTRKMK
eukprot:1689851-Pyramimonas_sp.AAC.2